MRLPEVIPLDGVSMDNVLQALRKASTDLANINKNDVQDTLHAYQHWYATAGETLAFLFRPDDVEKLLTTRRHWWLMDASATYREPNRWRAIGDSVRAEARDRKNAVDDLIAAIERIRRESAVPPLVPVVVPDTNFLLHYTRPFDKVDWTALAGAGPNMVQLLVPIAVIRELDSQKITAKRIMVGDPEEELRTRARVTLRKLRHLFGDPDLIRPLTAKVNVGLLLDPLSHHPRPETDLEIIERTLAAKTLIERDIKLATLDGGMEFAAKIEGLSVLSIDT